MKKKCPECGKGKARRICPRLGDIEICSSCCAGIRDLGCGDCPHYVSTTRYEIQRYRASSSSTPKEVVTEIDPQVTAEVDRALDAIVRGEVDRARSSLVALFESHPRHHDVAYGLGLVEVAIAKPEASIRWFDLALELDPCSLEAYYNRAVAHKELMKLPNCFRDLQKVMALGEVDEPVVVQARELFKEMAGIIEQGQGIGVEDFIKAGDAFDRGFEKMESSAWAEALEQFRTSASHNERCSPCHGNIALCLAALGRKSEALASIDRALELDPEYEPAINNRKILERMTEGQPPEDLPVSKINYAAERAAREGL